MTLDELAQDESFFYDLREGNFCLVVGAGFSYGLKNCISEENCKDFPFNSYDICKNIPIATQFIELTNLLFNSSKAEYKSTADLWARIFSDETFSDFFRRLFLVDKAQFEQTNLELYENILLPKWNRIFTFNFDNVLETVFELKLRKFEILFHPVKINFLSHRNIDEIAHLHGIITLDSDLDQIVFSGDSYSELLRAEHTLYDELFGAINDPDANINLIIVGCQFYEDVISKNFWESITKFRKNIRIYHFDIKNDAIKDIKFLQDKEIDYNFIQTNTKKFLEFIGENREKIETITYEGADVINKSFVKKINNGKAFSKANFYLSKQNNGCQWYGVIKNWDVLRKDYVKIKEKVIQSIYIDRDSKVSAVIFGPGGCGKSTMLRRLAIDCVEENFTVLWVRDFEQFYDDSLERLKYDSSCNYLVIMEDYYRLSNYRGLKDELIMELNNIPNVRLVIGDREITGKPYLDYLYNPDDNIFRILSDENEYIISKIIEIVPAWKSKVDVALSDPDRYKTTLYLLLFIIAHIEDANQENDIDYNDLNSHFRAIVKSDLKNIAKFNKVGLAKALFYWASVYKNAKLWISYDSFVNLADYFNGNNNISEYFRLDDNDSETKRLLDIYISIYEDVKGKKTVRFNHDLLAEEGLSTALLEDWQPYDNEFKLRLLDCLIVSFDYQTLSKYYYYLLINENKLFKNIDQKMYYLNILKKNGYISVELLNYIFTVEIYTSTESQKLFAIKILENSQEIKYHNKIINQCLNLLDDTTEGKRFAFEILEVKRIKNYDPAVVCKCLEWLKDTQEENKFAKDILDARSFENIDSNIILKCLKLLKVTPEAKKFAEEILKESTLKKVDSNITVKCLELLKDTPEAKKFAEEILKESTLKKVDSHIAVKSLELLKDSQEAKKFAEEILKESTLKIVDSHITAKCLELLKDTPEAKKFAEEILKESTLKIVDSHIVVKCLELLKDTPEAKKFAKEILIASNIKKDFPNLIVECLEIMKKTPEINQIVIEIIAKCRLDKKNDHMIILKCLNILKGNARAKQIASEIISNIRLEEVDGLIRIKYLNLSKSINEIYYLDDEATANIRFGKFDDSLLLRCLILLKTTQEAKQLAGEIIANRSKGKFDIFIIIVCYEILNDNIRLKEYAIELLEEWYKRLGEYCVREYVNRVVLRCLEILKDTSKGKKYAFNILEQSRQETIDVRIVVICLEILKDTHEAKLLAGEIIANRIQGKSDVSLIALCFEISKDTAEGKKCAIEFLEQSRIERFNGGIILNKTIAKCLRMLKKSPEGKQFAQEIVNAKTELSDPVVLYVCREILNYRYIGKKHTHR